MNQTHNPGHRFRLSAIINDWLIRIRSSTGICAAYCVSGSRIHTVVERRNFYDLVTRTSL
jgi:hypothetical protein